MGESDHEPVDALVGDHKVRATSEDKYGHTLPAAAAPSMTRRSSSPAGSAKTRAAPPTRSVVFGARGSSRDTFAAAESRGRRASANLSQPLARATARRTAAHHSRAVLSMSPAPTKATRSPGFASRSSAGMQPEPSPRQVAHRKERRAPLQFGIHVDRGASGDRGFARGIDVEKVHAVGEGEGGREFGLESGGPAVPVGLEHRNEAAARGEPAAQAGQQGPDLRGMVRIVLDGGQARLLQEGGLPAADARIARERAPRGLDPHQLGGGQGSGRVRCVEVAGGADSDRRRREPAPEGKGQRVPSRLRLDGPGEAFRHSRR